MINPSFIFYDDSYNRFRGKPYGHDYNFQLNSKGFKDVEFSESKGDKFRVIAIGDSFAFGVVPYEYNYLTVLEDKFNEEGYSAEVFNLGIPSIGPKQYLSILMNEGLSLNPNFLIVSFFVGNDFTDSGKKRKLLEYSYVVSLLRYIVSIRHNYTGKVVHGKPDYDDNAATFSDDKFLEIKKGSAKIYIKHNKHFPKYLDTAMYYLMEINRICKIKGIELVVVIIPDEAQVNTSLQSDIIHSMPHISLNQWDLTRPNRDLSKRLRKVGIQYLDLYDSFAIAAKEKRLYKQNDIHWNIAGNNFAAVQIKEYLQQIVSQ